MAYEDLLIDTCTIQRDAVGAVTAYGYKTEDWQDEHTDEPCRLMTTTGREVIVGAEVVVADYKLFLDDIDVTEQDRVQIVIDAVTVTFEILLVQNRQNGVGDHHKECLLRTVR
ncbi:hypothetical protein ES703_60486 [subsurface metagenome]